MDGKHGNSRSKPPGVLSTPSIPIGVIEATDVEKRCVLKKESELACPTRRAAFWQRSFDAPDLGICGLLLSNQSFGQRLLAKSLRPVHASPAVLLPPLLTHFQRLPCSRMCCTTKFPKVSRHSCGAPLSTSPAGGYWPWGGPGME